MDNQIENQVQVQPKNQKGGKGLIAVVIILVLAVIGLGGYIVYDKVLTKENGETTGSTKTESKVENQPKLLTNDEALQIGKELYIKTRDIAYNQGNKMQVDTSVCYSNENGQINQTTCSDFNLNKVSDVSFKNNFTANGLKQYEQKATEYGGGGFIVYNGDYYISNYKWGTFDGPWNTDATKITVKEINENSIILVATETFDNETIDTTFTIAKEDGTWKMDDYTDAGYLMWSKHLIVE